MKLSQKIKDFRKSIGLTQEEFAKVLKVNAKTVGYWEADKNPPNFSNLQTICENFQLPENYFKDDFNVRNVINTTLKDFVELDFYPDVFGSCGSGVFVLSQEKEQIHIPKKFFNHFSSVKQYSVINAIGDSMQPYIQNKDKLIVEHWEGEQIKDNQVYVFCYKDEIFVKRLIKNVDEIIIKSDNPDPIYRSRLIEKEEMNNITIVGEIVGLLRDMRI